jgi:hypothetical protein
MRAMRVHTPEKKVAMIYVAGPERRLRLKEKIGCAMTALARKRNGGLIVTGSSAVSNQVATSFASTELTIVTWGGRLGPMMCFRTTQTDYGSGHSPSSPSNTCCRMVRPSGAGGGASMMKNAASCKAPITCAFSSRPGLFPRGF